MRLRRANGRRPSAPREAGALSVFAALSLFVLLGFVGLAIDAGRAFVIHNEIQAAADSCALSAAIELNGAPDSAVRATSAGAYLAGRNAFDFQNGPVVIASSDITFSATLNGAGTLNGSPIYYPAVSVNGANMRYVKCTARANGIINYLMGAVGVNSMNLSASAIASAVPSQSTCTLPMALRGAAGLPAFGLAAGALFDMPTGFVWADTLNATDSGTLTTYRNQLVQYGTCGTPTPAGRCIGVRDTSDPKTLIDEWNSRFGVYKTIGGLSPDAAVPDLTGYGFTTTGSLVPYRDTHMPNRTPFTGNIPSFSVPTDVNKTYGAPYRRLTVMPVVDKNSVACGSNSKPILGWACVLLAAPINASESPKIEFIGAANSPDTPCRAAGVPGGSGAIGPLVPALIQ